VLNYECNVKLYRNIEIQNHSKSTAFKYQNQTI